MQGLSAALAVVLIAISPAQAMRFETEQVAPGQWAVGATGEIKPGDDEVLHQVVARMPANAKLAMIVLSSPGGNLLEGTRLARTIRNTGVMTGITGTCASACFLLWAAGTTKVIEHGARVGVHSASYQGRETEISQAVTIQMARLAHEFDVPAAIIGRMVSTSPDDMAWLSEDELSGVPGIKFVEADNGDVNTKAYEPGSALRPGSATVATPSNPAPVPGPGPLASAGSAAPLPDTSFTAPPPTAAFLSGKQARTEWEQWYTLVEGDVHDGAGWWAMHRSTAARDRLTCETQALMSQAWLYGCQQARLRLALPDRLRKTSPDFKAGWNSL